LNILQIHNSTITESHLFDEKLSTEIFQDLPFIKPTMSSTVQVLRFALVYSPPTLLIEYQNNSRGKFVKKITLRNIKKVKDVDVVVKELRAKYPELLGNPQQVQDTQIAGLVNRLRAAQTDVQRGVADIDSNSSNGSESEISRKDADNTKNDLTSTGTGTVMFKRVTTQSLQNEGDIEGVDLNKVSDVRRIDIISCVPRSTYTRMPNKYF